MKTIPLLAAVAALFVAGFASAQTPAVPATPLDAASLHRQSQETFKQKHFQESVELAEQAIKADPAKPEYFSQLGIALSSRMREVNFMQMAAISGRMRKAFEKSLELDPNHANAAEAKQFLDYLKSQ